MGRWLTVAALLALGASVQILPAKVGDPNQVSNGVIPSKISQGSEYRPMTT